MLRNPPGAPVEYAEAATNFVAGELAKVHATLDAMLAYAEKVRADDGHHRRGQHRHWRLGPGAANGGAGAGRVCHRGKRLHFVSNVDGHELAAKLPHLKVESTLFLIASKTFTTIETMTNAASAKAWFEAQGGTDIARHFAALTTNVAAANAFGITTTFGFWDWVGGRYSLWSAIGLPLAIAIGAEGFREFLAGAHAMDEHFRTAPLEHNLPVRLGLLDVWYRNFHGFTSRSIAPYHSALRRLPAYLQQLEMESNGKQVDASGEALPFGTSPVLWGEPGTNGQHAYFQMLHQGTDVVPVEFVAVKKARHDLKGHHPHVAGQCAGAGAGPDAGQERCGRPQEFPGQPAQHLLAAGRPDARRAGRADCAAGAPRVCQRLAVGHQQF